MDRRGFLRLLGLAPVALVPLAWASDVPVIATPFAPIVRPATPLALGSLTQRIADLMDQHLTRQFSAGAIGLISEETPHQLAVDLRVGTEGVIAPKDLDDRYLVPAATVLARSVDKQSPRVSGRLSIPTGVREGVVVRSRNGLFVRGLQDFVFTPIFDEDDRAYDDPFLMTRFDVLVG